MVWRRVSRYVPKFLVLAMSCLMSSNVAITRGLICGQVMYSR